jgi:hypothetical protein
MLQSKRQEIVSTIIKHGLNDSDFEIIETDLSDSPSSKGDVSTLYLNLKIDITYIPTGNSKSYMVKSGNAFELELEQDLAREVYV